MAASIARARRNKVFRSVFQTEVAQPTPILASTDAGEAFGVLPPRNASSPRRSSRQASNDTVTDQVKWDRAWHVVTTRIQLPSSVTAEDSFGSLMPQSQDDDTLFYEALPLILEPAGHVPHAAHTEDVIEWHARQARQHFLHHVLPLLAGCAEQADAKQVVRTTLQTLEAAHRQYLYGLLLIVRGIQKEPVAEKAVASFRTDLSAIIGNSWTPKLVNALRIVIANQLVDILGHGEQYKANKPRTAVQERRVKMAREELLSLLDSMQNVGLTGDRFQVLFAELMDSCMCSFIQLSYAGVLGVQQDDNMDSDAIPYGCLAHLCDWIENQYSRLAVEVFSRLGGTVAWADVEKWREIAVGRLATLRIQELFDIVLQWPHSKGALNDLKSAVTTPQRRLDLTDTFSAALQRRLLHPGRSTLYILQTYISMIRAFHLLDHSKVLLNRVVHALQLYLCQRDDAVRIVVNGLLCDKKLASPEALKSQLSEMATILDESLEQKLLREEEGHDWSDMTWEPDPVDAGANYKRPKNEDVIGTIISALGSEDVFIKEFQATVATRLLSKHPDFNQELKVLHLLKKRFGEQAVQNCDVMFKDIYDSKRIGYTLRKAVHDASPNPSPIAYKYKILSRLFWPNLTKDTFKVPEPIAELQEQYAKGFEQLKSTRKLNWLNQLGSVTVQLDLEDRSVEVECKTYEATVIYEFQNADEESGAPAQRNFNDIWQTLMLDEDLLEEALAFWVSKRVLRDIGDQNYEVIERLGVNDQEDAGDGPGNDAGDDGDDDARMADGGSVSPKKAALDPAEQERRNVYWQFIVGMLTNSAPAMPLGQILMMMKMLIADGCSWSNEELAEFLGEKIAEGDLELVGGKYKLVKK
ncbi:hypothetical protein VHEMI04009 [[Torrubiella] hemipterigena]|uniref:Anaphase-promoting complex subunit 2 n=1 Tax=[Torrubiella] hemipterigena TaxID=1531966 RepID=A0A0A1TF54_9HYPO|nr:hypothetical protein VHEMI04009 [[Torrubiella] hemipterigena]